MDRWRGVHTGHMPAPTPNAIPLKNAASAVLLSGKQQVEGWDALRAQGCNHFLGLAGRNDLVFCTLEECDGRAQPIGVVHGRAVEVRLLVGERSDHFPAPRLLPPGMYLAQLIAINLLTETSHYPPGSISSR